MPLLDHFQPPWKKLRPWEGVHSAWANAIAQSLNAGVLPPQFVAIPTVSLGGQCQVDVATIEEASGVDGNGVATAVATWAPPKPVVTSAIDFADLDTFEVQIFNEEDTPRLVAAIELVSPANKDRPSTRRAFVVKCGNYLCQSIGLIVVDVITSRSANLHQELLDLLRITTQPPAQPLRDLYAVAYRTAGNDDKCHLEYWPEPLEVGAALPSLPLWISDRQCVRVDLEECYATACHSLRMP